MTGAPVPERLAGRVALVTGAGSGIGRATARRLAAEGATVVGCDVDAATLQRTATLAEADGFAMTGQVCDISSVDAVDRLVTDVLTVHGRLDALANVAGILDSLAPAGDTTDEQWQRVIAVNLTGTFNVLRRCLPALVVARGAIVNIASIAGLGGGKAGAAYTASKHGVIGLTRNTAYHYAADGVRCNAVAPGGVETNIVAAAQPFHEEGYARQKPLYQGGVRTAQPEEVAAIVAWLVSDDASLVNGAVLTADAGWSAG